VTGNWTRASRHGERKSSGGEIVDGWPRRGALSRRGFPRRLGELLIDAGAKVAGGIDAGLLLVEICMAGSAASR